jgi:hypothetical protein
VTEASAGATLERRTFSAAMQASGSFPQVFPKAGSFLTNKFDAAAYAQPLFAGMGCHCWKPTGDSALIHP